jgi:hypothetical protein
MAQVIPQVVDMEEYASVYKERNTHLQEHFLEDNPDNKTVRLKGRNRIYYNYIKVRDLDDLDTPRLYCDILNPDYEEKANKIMEENRNPFGISKTPTFNTPPVFEKTVSEIVAPISFANLSQAFGDVEDAPF